MRADGGEGRGWGPLQSNLLLLTVVTLLVVNVGLFLRMNQLQQRILAALESLPATVGAPALPRGLEDGQPAPALELTDVEGRTVSLAGYRGRQVLVAFSSVTCPACEELYPDLRRFHDENPQLPLLMVSRGQPEENRALAAEQGFGFPVLHWQDPVARAFQVPGTPFFYLIGAEGSITRSGFASSAAEIAALACPDGC